MTGRRWWQPPLVIPRWVLTAKYALFVVLGVVAGLAGIPTLDLTTWEGYTTVWAALLAISAGFGAYGSARTCTETIETWGGVGVVSLLSIYAASALVLSFTRSQLGLAALAVALLIVTLLPGIRVAVLLSRTGLPHG